MQAAAIAELVLPSAINCSTSSSRGGQRVERVAAVRAHEDLRHHLRIEDGPAAADHRDGVQEGGHVGDPVFEQIAETPLVSEAMRSAA